MQSRAEITQILHLEPSFSRIPKTSPGQAAGGFTRTTALTATSAAFQTADQAACVGIQMRIHQVHQIIGDCQPAHSTQALSGTPHQRMLQQPAVLLTAVKFVLDRTAWDLPAKSSSSLILMSQVDRHGRMLPVCKEHHAYQGTCPGHHGELASSPTSSVCHQLQNQHGSSTPRRNLLVLLPQLLFPQLARH